MMQPCSASIVSENDQYDKYFYTAPAPRVTIEHSSDTESSRRPSQASPSISTSSSYSNLNKFDFSPSPRRNARKPSSNAPCRLNLPLGRSPGAHLASSASADDLFRMRNFSTSGKRIINKGDSILSRSNLSINLIGSSEHIDGRRWSGSDSNSSPTLSRRGTSPDRGTEEGEASLIYRVLMLGSRDVGKSAICSQVLSSENRNTYDDAEELSVEMEVIARVDGVESTIVFVDHPGGDLELEDLIESNSPVSCFLVVMAVDDSSSLVEAEAILNYLTEEGCCREAAVILIANKTDLVRNRIITAQEGENLANRHFVKYIETSPGINHNIDELLVGIIKQIRLRQGKTERKKKTKMMKFLGKVLKLNVDKSKSCSNLAVM